MAEYLEWRPTPPGRFGRHFIDGQEVHCGDLLELQLDDGAWVLGRYEWNPVLDDGPTFSLGDGAVPLTAGASVVPWPKPALTT
jgi:hypothetical protein